MTMSGWPRSQDSTLPLGSLLIITTYFFCYGVTCFVYTRGNLFKGGTVSHGGDNEDGGQGGECVPCQGHILQPGIPYPLRQLS